jgi:hypothetical protein
MESSGQRPAEPAASGLDMALVYRWVTVLTAGLVLVQAILAGRGWFVDLDLIDVHGFVGNLVFLVVIGQAVAAFLGRSRGKVGRLELGLSGLLVVLVVAQIGLGYSGRETAGAAAWHIPNGVLIFGIATALMTLGFKSQDS